MNKINKIKKFHEKIIEIILKNKLNNIEKNAFVRNRGLTFKEIITIIIGKKGRTTRMELFDFYKKAEKKAVSKQDYSKQRMKIKENFWIESNDGIVNQFYEEMKYETLNEYIVVAIDGSKTILPRCKELEEKYGLANANNSQQKCVQCLISGCYDVLNKIMMNIEIAPYASDERELAQKNIEHLKKAHPDKKVLIIFDRGYPSINLLYYLEKEGIKYIIRLQNSMYEKEKRNMKSNDEEIEIELNKDRLTGKMSEEVRAELKEKKVIRTRLIKCSLETGNIEWLVTNLEKKKYPSKKIQELYFKRWGIEIAYDELKNKLQIENISGKLDVTVRQDIYATIIVYNMIESMNFMLKNEIINKEENKHEYKINQNILIGAFKELFIELVITESEKKKKQLFELFYEYAIRCKTAIIPNRSNPRNFKDGSLKCKTNMKRSF